MRMIVPLALLMLPGSILGAEICFQRTLQAYIDLGSDGCTIGPTLFSSFEALSPSEGATAISPEQIGVTPGDRFGQPLLIFRFFDERADFEVLEAFFQFNVSGGPFVAKQLSMFGSSAEFGSVAVTVVEELCLGAPFDGCPSVPESLILFDIGEIAETSVRAPFNPTDFLGVRIDIVIDAGGGEASLGFVDSTFEIIPEPATWLFMLLGLVFLILARRGNGRAATEN